MRRKSKKTMKDFSQEEKDFIRGKSKRVKLSLSSCPKRLGYSPVQETASGAGAHGGGKRRTNKRDRKQAKESLKEY